MWYINFLYSINKLSFHSSILRPNEKWEKERPKFTSRLVFFFFQKQLCFEGKTSRTLHPHTNTFKMNEVRSTISLFTNPQSEDSHQIFSQSTATTIDLPPWSEWRIELEKDQVLQIRLESGTAEMSGTELSMKTPYTFKGAWKSFISTFHGCKLSYSGNLTSEYISEESCMSQYLTLHFALENQRKITSEMNRGSVLQIGPRVLVVGPSDSGKTTLCKTLASYAQKQERVSLLVNLDPRDSTFTVPGSLVATPVNDLLNVENVNLGETNTSGPSFYHAKQPLVKNFGFEKWFANEKLYKCEIAQLAETCMERMHQDVTLASSGLIIDTPAFSIKNVELIQHIIASFKINVLLVTGNERLFIDLKRSIGSPDVNILKVTKSSGCVEKDDTFIRQVQQRCIKEYFYGIDNVVLSPYSLTVSFQDVYLFKLLEKVDNEFELDDSIVPDFDKNSDSEFSKMICKVEPNSSFLNNAILSIVNPATVALDKYRYTKDDLALYRQVVTSSVIGYGYVSSCDDAKEKFRILIPSPARELPSKVLILTEMRYHE